MVLLSKMLGNQAVYSSKLLNFLMNKKVRVILGFLLSVVVSAFVFFGSDLYSWFAMNTRLNSLVVMTCVYFLCFSMIDKHFGYLNASFVIPIVLICLAFFSGFLFFFRLDYSVYFLTFSTLIMMVFFLLTGYVRRKNRNYKIAYIYSERTKKLPQIPRVEWVKITEGLNSENLRFDAVMADLRADLSDNQEGFLALLTLKKIPVFHSARLIEMLSGRVSSDHMYENEFGSLLPSEMYQVAKRIIDVFLVLASLPIVLPIMILTALVIVLESKGGVFFSQKRVGQNGVIFTLYKFRSMCKESEIDGNQFAQSNDARVTAVGRFIRKTRIDELPQFFNVLKGDMSLIGPRPEQESFVNEFKNNIPFYDYRHIVKPGISGWAQVMHGYVATTEDTKVKLEYDLFYIKKFSFSLDFFIFLKTIKTMLTGFGAR